MNKLLIGLMLMSSFSAFAKPISSRVVKSTENVGRITIETTTDDRGEECTKKLNEMRNRLERAKKTLLTDDDDCSYEGHPDGGKAIYNRTILFL